MPAKATPARPPHPALCSRVFPGGKGSLHGRATRIFIHPLIHWLIPFAFYDPDFVTVALS